MLSLYAGFLLGIALTLLVFAIQEAREYRAEYNSLLRERQQKTNKHQR